MAYSTPVTPVATAQLITAANCQTWSDDIIWLAGLKYNASALSALASSAEINTAISAKAHNSGTESINNTTWTPVTYDSEGANGWDSSNIHSVASNTDRFTVPVAGKYVVFGEVYWAANATGFRAMRVTVNSTQVSEDYRINLVATAFTMNHSWVVNCAANDIIRIEVYQSSGGALNITNVSAYGISASVTLLGV